MREIKGEIRSINASMSVVQEGIPEMLQRTDAIHNISSTLETRLENLQTCQQTVLPGLKDSVETLSQTIENRVLLRLDDIKQTIEIFQMSRLDDAQRSGEIQKCVSRAGLQVTGTNSIEDRPIRTVQARLLEKPSLLRDVCDEISHNSDLIQLASSRKSQSLVIDLPSRQSPKRSVCICRPSTYSVGICNPDRLRYSWGRWSGRLNASNLSHRKDCELFEKETLLNLKLMYYGGVIAGVVNASIHLRRGAGGFSLSPILSCFRVVSDDSPAFKLIRTQISGAEAPSRPKFDVVYRKLRKLFQDRRASPRDVNPHGQTLLHVSHLTTVSSFYLPKTFHQGTFLRIASVVIWKRLK